MVDEDPGSVSWVGPRDDPDRYRLGQVASSGSEGILYRGTASLDNGGEVDIAVKMLHPRFLTQLDHWTERWFEQIDLVRSLQFPGVVRVRDGFVGPSPHRRGAAPSADTLYLVMDWVDGVGLDTWRRQQNSSDPIELLEVLTPVAAALDMMHSGQCAGGAPVIHRDVKPANILVTSAGAELVDFGLVRSLPGGSRQTQLAGTPGYLAPEALDDGVLTPACDRYAFGAVAFFVLTGKEIPPKADPDTVARLLDEAAPLIDQSEIRQAVLAMLDADPERRPDSLSNWVAQMRRSSLGDTSSPLPPIASRRQPGQHQRSPGRRPRPSTIAALGAIAVVIAFAAVLLAVQPWSSARIRTYPEVAGGNADTWANYQTASGRHGPEITGGSTIQIVCRRLGYRVQDGNTWWYLIASAPWSRHYYATADAFYNNGATSGSLKNTPFYDHALPTC